MNAFYQSISGKRMQSIILKCKPGAQFHIGEGSLVDVSHIIHSDTLFSAIANIYEMVYKEGEEFVRLVDENQITISSAFPLLENIKSGSFIYFLPKPKIYFEQSVVLGKKEKKIKFISLNAFNKISEGFDSTSLSSKFDLSELHIFADEYALLKDELQISKQIKSPFIKEQIFPKTAVHKENREDAFYFQTEIQLIPFYDEDSKICYKPHFYFLLNESLNESEKKKFITCLRVLADEGIGGDRGSGKGFIEEVIIKEIEGIAGNQTNYSMILSLANPSSQSEFDNIIQYDLIKRGGGSIGVEGQPESHRKQVRMITEGSIINSNITGRVVDVSPSVNHYKHKVYRNGKAYLISMGRKNEE
ncbi:MAG: type III-A CRISPR-associated RAMP protein Csm4 [Ignavibacteriales bacterium UTCHB2]|jgi:CRISPR-associated protein Csm4|nr:MAG: hypothetical protein BWY38_01682 [Ignavibacteria bacterium ADurb.Bin266]OQY72707.1 MAG: type III-A CRISPR-associated RAMP protein Csm4 [Ignavibacteriales bacterium UTCHB2]